MLVLLCFVGKDSARLYPSPCDPNWHSKKKHVARTEGSPVGGRNYRVSAVPRPLYENNRDAWWSHFMLPAYLQLLYESSLDAGWVPVTSQPVFCNEITIRTRPVVCTWNFVIVPPPGQTPGRQAHSSIGTRNCDGLYTVLPIVDIARPLVNNR